MALGADAALPDATAAVRKLVRQVGPVPSNRRNGTLVLAQLRRAQGSRASYVVAARDHSHTFYALITLRQQYARWVVGQLTRPGFIGPVGTDLPLLARLRAAHPRPPGRRHRHRPAHRRRPTPARGFLQGYLP
jgi:hypothetical protein